MHIAQPRYSIYTHKHQRSQLAPAPYRDAQSILYMRINNQHQKVNDQIATSKQTRKKKPTQFIHNATTRNEHIISLYLENRFNLIYIYNIYDRKNDNCIQ